ncbi:RelA/SpoT [Penicillium macrosclerotiorum]|uniref:RelA/SpoT n=1 Tax=Penicillium macrosclerotiorum TaxID=303699 RepID=UPI0025482E69|nr:RelA/SpoT [Penicillium macrosclerotiorum]KAJ5669030.1 RelA/SpoT [Penicillium macrosclerotiorum]
MGKNNIEANVVCPTNGLGDENSRKALERLTSDPNRHFNTVNDIINDPNIIALFPVQIIFKGNSNMENIETIIREGFEGSIEKSQDHGSLEETARGTYYGKRVQLPKRGKNVTIINIPKKHMAYLENDRGNEVYGQVEVQIFKDTRESHANLQQAGSTPRPRDWSELASERFLFSDSAEVKICFGVLLEHYADDWANRQERGSSEALLAFLQARDEDDSLSLALLIERHLGPVAEKRYSDVEKEYKNIKMNLILYIIDQNVLNDHGLPKKEQGSLLSESNILIETKIEALRGAIIWMDKLLKPVDRFHNKILDSQDPMVLQKGLQCLIDFEQEYSKDSGSLKADGVEGLCKIFENHPQRPIRMAFSMSMQKMLCKSSGEDSKQSLKKTLDILNYDLTWCEPQGLE